MWEIRIFFKEIFVTSWKVKNTVRKAIIETPTVRCWWAGGANQYWGDVGVPKSISYTPHRSRGGADMGARAVL